MRAASVHRLLQSRSGSAAIIFGLTLPILAALVGIAIDYSGWTRTKAKFQVITDRAALAGAQKLIDDALLSKSVREAAAISAALATITEDVESSALIVDDGTSVQVDVSKLGTGHFLGVIGVSTPRIGVTATAEVANELPVCVIALAPNGNGTLSIQGRAGLDASPCIVWVNSSAPQALRVGSNAHLRGMRNCVVGGWSTSGTGNVTAQPQQCRVFDDPLAEWQPPSSTGCNYNNFSVSGTEPVRLKPGTYCGGVSITASNVEFEPGTYIIKDGPMKVTGSGDIIGNGVGIYLTGAKSTLELASSARLRLSGPTSGAMEGLVIAGDRIGPIRNGSVRGGVALDIEGTVYLPGHSAEFAGGADTSLSAEFSQFIAHTLNFTGNSTTSVRTNYNRTAVPRIALNTSTIRLKR